MSAVAVIAVFALYAYVCARLLDYFTFTRHGHPGLFPVRSRRRTRRSRRYWRR